MMFEYRASIKKRAELTFTRIFLKYKRQSLQAVLALPI